MFQACSVHLINHRSKQWIWPSTRYSVLSRDLQAPARLSPLLPL